MHDDKKSLARILKEINRDLRRFNLKMVSLEKADGTYNYRLNKDRLTSHEGRVLKAALREHIGIIRN